MNLENLEKLAQWLEAGAPHVIFDMNVGVCPLTDQDVYDQTDYLTLQEYIDAHPNPTPDCGTACCMAGAAYLMSQAPEGQLFPSLEAQAKMTTLWTSIRNTAADFLGLHISQERWWVGHELFDQSLAPNNCTPAQAAAAVRRVMAGEAPWV
jgi:hypothetical protein